MVCTYEGTSNFESGRIPRTGTSGTVEDEVLEFSDGTVEAIDCVSLEEEWSLYEGTSEGLEEL